MLKSNTTYKFKEEFCKELNISMYQAERKMEELLVWLTNFFEFEFLDGRPKRIHIKEIIGEYQPLPRKLPKQDELNQQKRDDYERFTIAALGTEFKPNSKARIARQAIEDFGLDKYGHMNYEAVSKRYVKEPFNKYGVTNNQSIWVWYSTYEPLDEKTLEQWRIILSEEHISEAEAANAFYRQEQGQDVSKEKGFYKKAQDRFKEEFKDIAVLVKKWKCK